MVDLTCHHLPWCEKFSLLDRSRWVTPIFDGAASTVPISNTSPVDTDGHKIIEPLVIVLDDDYDKERTNAVRYLKNPNVLELLSPCRCHPPPHFLNSPYLLLISTFNITGQESFIMATPFISLRFRFKWIDTFKEHMKFSYFLHKQSSA